MTTLLRQGYEKILRIFYADRNARIHLREIARRAGLNENSASRFLKGLEKERILTPEKDGNLKKYSINKESKTYSILTLFDIEKYNKLPSIRRNAINTFMQELKEKPVINLLFGSTAKETYKESSDIDLLLITNNKISTNKAEEATEAQTGIKINTLQINYNEFIREVKIKEDKVIQSAINTGYPLTNHVLYYGEVMK